MNVEVLHNAGLLLAMAYLYDLLFLGRRWKMTVLAQLAVGAGLGLIAIGVMASSWKLMDGVILDTRSVLLGASGLFFGLIPTSVAMVAAAVYRLVQGGGGADTGVAVIAASGTIGLLWRSRRREHLSSLTVRELYLVGIVIHVVLLVLFVVIPVPDTWETLRLVTLPVLLIHPATFALLGILMVNRLGREEASRGIEESELRYRSIFENRHVVMFILDPDTGRIVDANPRAVEFYGWGLDELRGMHITRINLLPMEVLRGTMGAARNSTNTIFNFQHHLASGEVRDVEVQSGPVRYDGRDLLLSLVFDVTERRRLERGLHDAEQQLRTLLDKADRSERTLSATLDELRQLSQAVEQSPAAVVITDLDGRIEYVNPAFSQVTGYGRDEVVGQNPRILKSGLTTPDTYHAMWSTIAAGQSWHGELCNRTKDGQLIWERAVISPVVDDDGRAIRYLAVKQDITVEREMTEQLRQAQKMEAVGRLAGGVAHDFNNKLQVILGYTELLASAVRDEDVLRHLGEVRKAAEQSAALTRQLLAFARRQPIQPEVIEVDEAVHHSLELVGRLIGEHIQTRWEPGAPGQRVRIDPGQLDQILTNLAVNARDAMPEGGVLRIRTAVVRVDDVSLDESTDATPGDFVLLTVDDTGAGIDDTVLSTIFEPFVTTKPKGAGTGLGLATVYGIVRQNRGLVRARNRPEGGASFMVYLPCASEHLPVEAAPAVALDEGRGTVLVVEDEAAIKDLVHQTLVVAGYEVLAASDGTSALDHVRTLLDGGRTLDLLVTDVVMPEMNGRELSEHVSGMVPGVQVLFLSGYTADVIAEHGLMADDVEFLAKPFSTIELTTRVHDLLES